MQWETAYGSARQPPELMHYGIKGQKWGIRRFQNEDRSLTAEGKARYGRGGKSSGKTGGLKKPKKRNWKPEDAENLSDEELNRRNSRLQREQQYKDQTTPKWKKEAKQTGKDWAKEAVKRIFVGTAVTLAVAVMTSQYKKAQRHIGDYANHKLKELRQAKSTKDSILNAVQQYDRGGSRARSMHNAGWDRFVQARKKG